MSLRPSPLSTMTALEWGMLLALSLLWGGSFFFNGVAVLELLPLTIVVARLTLAAITLWIAMRIMGLKMPHERSIWVAFFAMGLLNNAVPFTLIVWGQTHIASGVASILNATTPLFTVIVAHIFTQDEKITVPRLLGIVVGFLGVALMIGGDAIAALGVNVLAQLAVLVAATSYAFAGVYGRRFRTLGITPIATATGQVTASSLILIPIMLIIDRPWTLATPSLSTVGALLGIAILSTAVAYILYFRILATAGATNLLLVTFLVPVSAIFLGVLILGEHLMPSHIIGMALISIGLTAIDGRLWKRIFKR